MTAKQSRRQSVSGLLSVQQAANLIDFSYSVTRNLCISGEIPAINISSSKKRREYRIHASSLLNFLQKVGLQPTPQLLKHIKSQQESHNSPEKSATPPLESTIQPPLKPEIHTSASEPKPC